MDQQPVETNQDQFKTPGIKGSLTSGLWITAVIFFGQNAWASVHENEIRAGIIYAGFTLLLFFGGIANYFSRKFNQ